MTRALLYTVGLLTSEILALDQLYQLAAPLVR
jgi:hypothetical protein